MAVKEQKVNWWTAGSKVIQIFFLIGIIIVKMEHYYGALFLTSGFLLMSKMFIYSNANVLVSLTWILLSLTLQNQSLQFLIPDSYPSNHMQTYIWPCSYRL